MNWLPQLDMWEWLKVASDAAIITAILCAIYLIRRDF